MIKYLLTFLLLKGILWGCALCSIYSPRTDVNINIKADNVDIKTAEINWIFAKPFTDELLKLYDINLDKNFDNKELKLIEESLIAYIKPKNYLTFISYSKKIEKESLDVNIENYKLSYKKNILSFKYKINLNYKIIDKNKLYIKIVDKEEYFLIFFDEKKQLMHIPYKISKVVTPNDVSFTINAPNLSLKNVENERYINSNIFEKNIKAVEILKPLEIVEKEIFSSEINISLLEKFIQNIKKHLLDIEKGEDKYALFFLLVSSFIYGVLHALGPGHGKALAFSYFSSQKSSYFQAFVISLATAFVHIIGALILVLVSVFVLESVLNRFMENSISYITAFSAVVIMLLALYILYRKLNKKSSSCCSCNIDLKSTNFSINSSSINFVRTSTNKLIMDTQARKKQDLIFVLIAGIIPCPGTVLLFVYAFLLKTYFSVFLASIAISLGMAVIIFASSFLGVSVGKVSAKSRNIKNILEIVAPIFMFILGLLLLLNSNNF